MLRQMANMYLVLLEFRQHVNAATRPGVSGNIARYILGQ